MPLLAADPDVDLDALSREELTRLQREYRLMEGDRHGLVTGTKLNRELKMMEHLRSANQDIKTDLNNADSMRHQHQDKSTMRLMTSMVELYEQHLLDMKGHVAQIEDEEAQVDKITARVVKQKLKAAAMYGHAMTPPAAARRLRILENRLYNATTQYDSRCSENNYIRSEINMMLLERGRFHCRYTAIKGRIQKSKSSMLSVVDLATQTYELRDEYVSKIKSLRERDEKDSRQHVLEMKELQRVLHNDEKTHKFIETKGLPRPAIEEDEDRKLRHTRQNERDMEDLLYKYQTSVREILEVAGVSDVDHLCNAYNEQEQKNFARFSFISDLNHECEVIKEATEILKLAIERVSKSTNTRMLAKKEAVLNKREELINKKAYLLNLREKLDAKEEYMQGMINIVQDSFILAKCESSPLLDLLGTGEGITSKNVVVCLHALETNITELKKQVAVLEVRKYVEIDGGQATKGTTQTTVTGSKTISQGGPFKPKVILTGHLNPADEDDEEEKAMDKRPIYIEQFRRTLTNKIKSNTQDTNEGGLQSQVSMESVQSRLKPSGSSKSRAQFNNKHGHTTDTEPSATDNIHSRLSVKPKSSQNSITTRTNSNLPI